MENNENNKPKFNINGLPDLGDIEIPDETPKKKSHQNNPMIFFSEDMGKMNIDDLKKMLPPEFLNMLDHAQTGYDSVDDLLNDSLNIFKKLDFSKFGKGMNNDFIEMLHQFESLTDDNCQFCQDCEDDSEKPDEPALYDRSLLEGDVFGSVPCLSDSNLYENFLEVYGTNEALYTDPTNGIKTILLSEITKNLNLGKIENLTLVSTNNKYILFFANPKKEEGVEPENQKFGFFLAVIKTPDNNFSMVIPEYGNTFFYDKETNEVGYYTNADAIEYFLEPDGSINDGVYSAIDFSIQFMLSPVKSFLLSAAQFGSVKVQRHSYNENSNFIQIGIIESNESPEAILFKKDADLDLKETKFPFYFKFPDALPKGLISIFTEAISKCNLNESAIFKNSELHYDDNGNLYINIDINPFSAR